MDYKGALQGSVGGSSCRSLSEKCQRGPKGALKKGAQEPLPNSVRHSFSGLAESCAGRIPHSSSVFGKGVGVSLSPLDVCPRPGFQVLVRAVFTVVSAINCPPSSHCGTFREVLLGNSVRRFPSESSLRTEFTKRASAEASTK